MFIMRLIRLSTGERWAMAFTDRRSRFLASIVWNAQPDITVRFEDPV